MATATALKLKNATHRSSKVVQKKKIGKKVVQLFTARISPRTKSLSEAAREALVIEYRLKARKLARSILRKWHARLDLEEVDSVVDLSLCEAVRRFDPRKGASFMTFLFYHLRGNLIRVVTAAAMANMVPMGSAEALEGNDAQRGDRQRGVTYRGANAIEVAEALCNYDCSLPDEILFKKELVGLSQEACSRLDNLEREVIQRIYIEGQQLMDIAKVLGYSRCHISRVKKKALETLQRDLASTMISPELNDEEGARSDRGFSALGRKFGRRRIQRAALASVTRKSEEQNELPLASGF